MDTGITHELQLVNGRFAFVQGGDKKRLDLMFFLSFNFTRRIYRPEYNPGLGNLIQKPMSYIRDREVLILGNLKSKINSFISNVTIQSMAVGSDRKDKTYFLALDYVCDEDILQEPKQLIRVI